MDERVAHREPGTVLRLLMVLLGIVGFVLVPGAGRAASAALGDGTVRETLSPTASSARDVTRTSVAPVETTATVRHVSDGGSGQALTPADAEPSWPHHPPAGQPTGAPVAHPGVALGAPHGRAPPAFPGI